MEKLELQSKLKEIDEIVATLNEPVKTLTAQELIKRLFNEGKSEAPAIHHEKQSSAKRSRKNTDGRKLEAVKTDEENDRRLISTINRTEYPEIHSIDNNLDRALFILKIMKEKGYDGLNASQINQILTEVFRIKSNQPVISMALIRDKRYTEKKSNSYKGTISNVFRIMHPGEQHIEGVIAEIKSKKSGDERKSGGSTHASGEPKEE